MKLLLCLSSVLGCWSLAVPLQKPVRVQENVEKLEWTELHCMPTVTSAGNDTVCMQEVFNAVVDPDIPVGPTVTQYCGYIRFKTLNTKMFFWLVMSETTDPRTSPLVVWMNGGPGVSSLVGLFYQWGPKLADVSQPTVVTFIENQSRMTEKMSWMFLEQPVGVGYSRSMVYHEDSDAAAQDVSAFLDAVILDTTFQYQGSTISLQQAPLHLAGESYAGHYLPAIGWAMVNSGQATRLKLESIFCGSALVDELLIGQGITDMVCGPNPAITLTPTESVTDRCSSTQAGQVPECTKAIKNCRKVKVACQSVLDACLPVWGSSWAQSFGKNPYDVNEPYNKRQEVFDYFDKMLTPFLDKSDRKKRYGVDKTTKWTWNNPGMKDITFLNSGDEYRSYVPEIGKILDAGIDFMLYVGDKDLIAPWPSVKEVSLAIQWSEPETALPGFPLKQDRLHACMAKPDTTYTSISTPGAVAPYGHYVRAGHFNYARIMEAGHSINRAKPAQSKHLFETWVFARESFAECTP